jgi:adenosine kinase
MSDETKEQIGVWQPNAHENFDKLDIVRFLGRRHLKDISVAIFSGQPSVVIRHMKAVRKLLGKKVRTIFDPGQMIPFYDKKTLAEGLKLSDIFIANDVETRHACQTLGCSVEEILKYGPSAVIETKGALGSVIFENGKNTIIKAVKPKQVIETTGAGDAFRAGLIYGIVNGLDLKESCRIGAVLGARNVETVGGQGYEIDPGDLKI